MGVSERSLMRLENRLHEVEAALRQVEKQEAKALGRRPRSTFKKPSFAASYKEIAAEKDSKESKEHKEERSSPSKESLLSSANSASASDDESVDTAVTPPPTADRQSNLLGN